VERDAHPDEVGADGNAERCELAQKHIGGLVNELDVTQQPTRSPEADEKVMSGRERIGSHRPKVQEPGGLLGRSVARSSGKIESGENEFGSLADGAIVAKPSARVDRLVMSKRLNVRDGVDVLEFAECANGGSANRRVVAGQAGDQRGVGTSSNRWSNTADGHHGPDVGCDRCARPSKVLQKRGQGVPPAGLESCERAGSKFDLLGIEKGDPIRKRLLSFQLAASG
jgi:hypothetical protein